MSKLWDKGYSLNRLVEEYMTGDDPDLDMRLAKHDCNASIAHAKMLAEIGIISQNEYAQLLSLLNKLKVKISKGEFIIEKKHEDIHTAIENYLVQKLGDTGKKIHTARSRNDQVLTAIRLYCKEHLAVTLSKLANVIEVFYNFALKYQEIPYVGRTHYQKAMPSSFGLWIGAFIESLLDDSELLISSYRIIDQCPLGSAASYGISIPIDRQLTSDILNFAEVQNNVLYANNSRGKFESIIIHGLSQIMLDLGKLSTDVILFSTPEMGYLNLPQKFCSGSSLMPNKRNPDPFELIRAKSATVFANLWQTIEIIRSLPSGYNRDFQETKRPLFNSFDIVESTLDIVAVIMAEVYPNYEKCLEGFSPDVFATDYTLQLVKDGIPFRDAYKQVGLSLEKLTSYDPVENLKSKTHLGATGNLGLDKIYQKLTNLKNISFINLQED